MTFVSQALGRWSLAALALGMAPASAFAHTIIPGVSGFEGGLLHPLLVPSHALCMVALSLLLALRPAGERHAAIATFASALAGAIALVTLAFQTDYAEITLLAVAAICGVFAAARAMLPLLAIVFLAALGALALQFDSVPASISISETLLTLCGAALSALVMLALIVAAAAHMTGRWQAIALRILGSWIAAIALMLLALKLR